MRAARPDASSTARIQRAFLGELGGFARRGAVDVGDRFRRPPRGTVAHRWHVYAHGYVARLTEALSLEYVAIARILGPEAFAALVTRYIEVFSPRSSDLAHAGDRLARFLEFDALTLDLPFLPDLAHLEAAVSDCFTAADAVPAEWEALQRLELEQVLRLSFGLVPGVALIGSAWPVADLWNVRFEVDDESVSIPVEGRPQSALVWRNADRIRVAALSPEEASLVAAANVGLLTLEELFELSGAPAEAASLSAMLNAFRSLLERGVFVQHRSAGWTGSLEISKEES